MPRARRFLHRFTHNPGARPDPHGMNITRTPDRWPDREPTLMAVWLPLAAAARLLEPTNSDVAGRVRDLLPAFLGRPDGVPDTVTLHAKLRPLVHELRRGEPAGRYRRAAELLIEAGRAGRGLDAWHEQRQARGRRS